MGLPPHFFGGGVGAFNPFGEEPAPGGILHPSMFGGAAGGVIRSMFNENGYYGIDDDDEEDVYNAYTPGLDTWGVGGFPAAPGHRPGPAPDVPAQTRSQISGRELTEEELKWGEEID